MKRVCGPLIGCVLLLAGSFVIAKELGEEIDFFEFLADFHDDDQWIDPFEIEAWTDRRLRKTPATPDPEPREEVAEKNSDVESVYEHHHVLDQTPVMDETDHAADERHYEDD